MLHPIKSNLRGFVAMAAAMAALGLTLPPAPGEDAIGWRTQPIHSDFLTEGAAAADLDGDGVVDLIAGPVWYRGPDFDQRHELTDAPVVNVMGYSQHFFSFAIDADGDGDQDVLDVGFPGRAAKLYLNPSMGSRGDDIEQHWPARVIAPAVSNESPQLIDLIPGGLPELVCVRDRAYGYYAAGGDATQLWNWTAVSTPGSAVDPFGHGLGCGDVDGDGRLDVLDRQYWWRQPETVTGEVWTRNLWRSENDGSGGAQIHVTDVDGDGDADIITSRNAHGYGLDWYAQQPGGRFERHPIAGESSTENPYGFAVSQLHAVEVIDINGDGVDDIVTGKRYLAHGGKDRGALQPPVVAWLQCVRLPGGEVEFRPHAIDDRSGVGVEVLVTDLNGDKRPDVVSSNKAGLAVHYQGGPASEDFVKWRTAKTPVSDYVDGRTPEDAARSMRVPDGFDVDLIASEPDLVQPIAMCFDDRGRLWVVEGHTYPAKAAAGEGQDRVMILSDEDADGTFETRKVFTEGLNLASGIEVGFGGVWIGAAPELLFIPDADGDDVPDASPRVVLDGWGYQDTHETLNSFTWGPDGWLYGCHGVFTHSVVGRPGTPEDQRVRINAGVWRLHPVTHDFDVFAHGTSNPWGVDFDAQGECFITACVIPHLFHLTQGGRYIRQASKHFDPYTYTEIETIADHLHYGDGTFASSKGGKVDRDLVRRNAATTSEVGGGHAHCGLAIYQSDQFPAQYHGDLFFHNLHGHRVVRERIETNGSGFVGRHRPDFAMSEDHRQIGVGIVVGPDGAIYTSDWHDPQTCHDRNPEIWDRTDGRIFRIRYGDVKPQSFDLKHSGSDELIEMLRHPNQFFRVRAQRLLQERVVRGDADASALMQTLTPIVMGQNADWTPSQRLRTVWTAHAIGGLGEGDLATLLQDSDPVVRRWAVRLLGDRAAAVSPQTLVELTEMASGEMDLPTRRQLASLTQRLPVEQRWGVVEGLLGGRVDQHDINLPSLVWYGLESLVVADPQRALSMIRDSGWETMLQFAIRRTAVSPGGREALVASLGQLTDPGRAVAQQRRLILDELLSTARSRAGVAMPPSWPQTAAALRDLKLAELTNVVNDLAVQFGDRSSFPAFRETLVNSASDPQRRLEAMRTLSQFKDPQLPGLLLRLIDDPAVASEAIRSLAAFDDSKADATLIDRYQDWPTPRRSDALNVLSSRVSSAERLVDAMESGKIDPASVPAYIVQQIVTLQSDGFLKDRLEAIWGRIGNSQEVDQKLYEKYLTIVTPEKLQNANLATGKALYETNCGKCHRLFGEGGNIGPDLTGANRQDMRYWLDNILYPSAVVGNAYQMVSVLTVDGRVISGLVTDRNEDAVTLQTPLSVVVVPQEDIDDVRVSPNSLMPEGQLEPMTEDQVRDLFAYLSNAGPASGADGVEAESLTPFASVTAGRLSVQGMKSFGDRWSGDHQLWWRGGGDGDALTLRVPTAMTGEVSVMIEMTAAPDYGQVAVRAGGAGSGSEAKVDLYARQVTPAPPVLLRGTVPEGQNVLPIEFRITGSHPDAAPRRMVGIDRISVMPAAMESPQ